MFTGEKSRGNVSISLVLSTKTVKGLYVAYYCGSDPGVFDPGIDRTGSPRLRNDTRRGLPRRDRIRHLFDFRDRTRIVHQSQIDHTLKNFSKPTPRGVGERVVYPHVVVVVAAIWF